jgi:hypothetical protein
MKNAIKTYKVIFKCLFDTTRVEYTVLATDATMAREQATQLHEAHEMAHIREDYRFHMAVRTA